MTRCARCDFHPVDDDAAEAHARETGHLRCIVCRRRSLTDAQPQTCSACVARVRLDLAELVEGYAMLEPRGLAGLTLLGDGSMQRRAHGYELASVAAGRPIRDEWPSDPLPVVAALASWEDFWRADFGDETGGPATLAGVVGYLTRNLDTGHRAAQTHPAFDEFAADVAKLRADVRHTVGLADVPVEAKADCFDCGGPLLRTYAAPATQLPDRRAQARRRAAQVLAVVRRQRDAEASYGVTDLTPWPLGTARRESRLAMLGVSREGLTDDWTCGWCRRTYDQPSYFLALRAAASSWVPVPLAAETARRPVRTVRSWAVRGLIGAACRVVDRTVVVWWPDVSDRAFRAGEHEEAS